MGACTSCGAALAPGAKFCGVCGTVVAPAASPPGTGPGLGQLTGRRSFTGGLAFLNTVPLPPGVGLLAVGGAILVLLGSLLPWVSGVGSWTLDLIGLVTFSAQFAGGVPVGLVMLGVLAVGAPYVTHKPLPPRTVLVIGVVAAGIAVLTIVRIFTTGAGLSPGIGVILSAIGGGMILYEGMKGPLMPAGGPAPAPPPSTGPPPPAVANPPQPPPPPAPSASRICSNCGRPGTGPFCGSCGSRIT